MKQLADTLLRQTSAALRDFEAPAPPGDDERQSSAAGARGNPVARRSPSSRLSVGVLLDDARQERWVLEAVRRVLTLPGVRLAAVAVASGQAARPPDAGLLHAAIDSVDRALRCRGEPLFQLVDVVAELNAPHTLVVPTAALGGGWSFDSQDAARLADLGVDAWFCFTARRPHHPLASVARFGIWGHEIGVGTTATNRWAGASEVAGASELTVTALVDYSATNGASIYQTFGATVSNSARSNRLQALCKALPMCARAVAALLRGDVVPSSAGSAPRDRSASPAPTSSAVLGLATSVIKNVAANRWREMRWRDQWQVGYYFRDPHDDRLLATERLRYLLPPADRFWADPFAVERDGRYFIFFEELLLSTGRGRIAAVEVFENDEPSAPRVVLEQPHHLSYPTIFTWRDDLYMLPETGAAGSVLLYRCAEFPLRWVPDHVMLAGVHAYDPTLWSDGRRWWLFANVAESGADPSDELWLFSSDTPLGGWRPHPANPIVADVRCARPAGPIFTDRGVTYRPSQDCSGSYGRAVVINRIDCLTPDEYRETRVARVAADWRPDARCAHTYGRGRLQVIDCLVRRSKWRFGRRLRAASIEADAPPALAGGADPTTGARPVG